MHSVSTAEPSDLVTTLAPVLAATDPSDHPLLIAMLERWAAERYREWAEAVGDIAHVTLLLACAEREEEIAARVEGLFSDSEAVQARLAAANPLLKAALAGGFTWRPIDEQFAAQAAAERLGAATWRAFARRRRSRRRPGGGGGVRGVRPPRRGERRGTRAAPRLRVRLLASSDRQ